MSRIGRRVGVAILSVDLEDVQPARILIRVRTVDDVIEQRRTVERTFPDAPSATAYLQTWLTHWQAGGPIDDG